MSMHIPNSPMPPAALNELKGWLRIENNAEDALLIGQLRAAMELAAQFTGQQLIITDIAETLPVTSEWMRLTARPVTAIQSAIGLIAEAPDFTLTPDSWQADIDRDARGWVRIMRPGAAGRVRVLYRAGMAANWHSMPEALRQGVLRYAAYGYSNRENASSAPPAAVSALWRPWRKVRL